MSSVSRYRADIATYLSEASAVRSVITRLAARYHLTVLDPADILCQDGLCRVANPSPLYSDTNHLTTAGAKQLIPLFEAYFAEHHP